MLEPSTLEGIRVVELTHAIAGPQTAQILADHGADVIKVEPATGETARGAFPLHEEDSIYFSNHNRGKRSVVLDFKSDFGKEALRRLIERADIVVTNYTAEVPARNGWGWEDIKAINPRTIMVHITGFGTTGPDKDLRALDGIIQAMSGIPDFTGTDESGPILVGAFVADHTVAYHAALGAVMALLRREKTGHGEFVDVSMIKAYMAMEAHAIQAALEGKPLPRAGNKVSTALTGAFEASDGWIVVAPLGQAKWELFVKALELDDPVCKLSYDEVLADHRELVDDLTTQWTKQHTRAEIMALMVECGIPAGPILSVAEAAQHSMDIGAHDLVTVTSEHGYAIKVPAPVTSVGLSQSPRRWNIPTIGQDTDAVLAELGLVG